MSAHKWTEADVPDQSGRIAIVTGSNTGLGFDTARVLAQRGAKVVMAVRDTAKGDAAAAQIRTATPAADVTVHRLDLARWTRCARPAPSWPAPTRASTC